MKFTTKEDILNANTKSQRSLKRDNLKAWYTEEELKDIIRYEYPDYVSPPTLSDIKYREPFETMREEAKKANMLHKWTPEEDAFLTACYKYLSDSTIGLALNIPAYYVSSRRKVLKLSKQVALDIEVIVWSNRENFEGDMKKERLTKARPDIVDTMLRAKREDDG